MKLQRLAIGLSAVNLFLLALLLGRGLWLVPPAAAGVPQASPPAAPEVAPVLRGRALEIVDEHGQIRSRLNVEADGAVVLRLIDRTGTIRVKLGADEGGSGWSCSTNQPSPGSTSLPGEPAHRRRPRPPA